MSGSQAWESRGVLKWPWNIEIKLHDAERRDELLVRCGSVGWLHEFV